jgi:four helix bundle protein
MTNQTLNSNNQKFDLEERTAKFGEMIIDFAQTLSRNPINNPLISQLIRSATSVGANYCEANEANTKKDFRHKIALVKKEAKETMHWLRMISRANPVTKDDCQKIWKEAHELVLIFAAIFRK